jgi:hypothetical protein
MALFSSSNSEQYHTHKQVPNLSLLKIQFGLSSEYPPFNELFYFIPMTIFPLALALPLSW